MSNIGLTIFDQPFDVVSTPMEIINLFGGKKQYLRAITELEQEIYAA